ncbi:acetyl-CoA carboxylase, biotin carboxylase subunit [Burkholderiales bacterium]|nr:acetyl-CoA carboxylase, biotin carboxylase subunit [Burkholderiales bacterium]
MFAKLLIADRGAAALCVLRACRELGIRTVAVHSEADRELAYLRLADESVCIGPELPADSYLNVAAVISAAELTDADAIHPGNGPLADDPDFAEAVEASGFRFVGPEPALLRLAADRMRIRSAMRDIGMPSVPYHDGPPPSTVEGVAALARRVGFPVIVKDRAARGGRAPQIVHSPATLILAINHLHAQRQSTVGPSSLHIEHYLARSRHIQVQVLADGRGRAIHLGTRDCSIRHERRALLAEAPAPGIPPGGLADICQRCAAAAVALGLRGAATFDLLYEGGGFLFLALVPSVDPAHAATEAVTGVDLVREQILVAADQSTARAIELQGHAIACHLHAEHPFRFVPSVGRIAGWHMPGGPWIRLDSSCNAGSVIRPQGSTLLGNLTARGADRAQAIARMRGALGEAAVEGIRTNLRLHQGIMDDDGFRRGSVHIGYLDEQIARRYRPGRPARRG